jgi:hypothetical protein
VFPISMQVRLSDQWFEGRESQAGLPCNWMSDIGVNGRQNGLVFRYRLDLTDIEVHWAGLKTLRTLAERELVDELQHLRFVTKLSGGLSD